MNKEDELEFLKCDLENIIAGMTICEGILSQEEKDHGKASMICGVAQWKNGRICHCQKARIWNDTY